jgi:hypothetical protein
LVYQKLTASAAKGDFLQTAKLFGFFSGRFFPGFSKERTYTPHLFFLQQLTMRPKSLQAFFSVSKGRKNGNNSFPTRNFPYRGI